MNIKIDPTKLSGTIQSLPSKSQAHRLLICAAFADQETTLYCPQTNLDIEATAGCLCALGAQVIRTGDSYCIAPAITIPETAELFCKESGSTLRFMLPIVGALGIDAVFHMEGRLAKRPLSPLWEEMERMGCQLSRPTESTIRCQGRLHAGEYRIDGSVSSQFITGLLLALNLLPQQSTLQITGKIESAPYIEMTKRVLKQFSVDPDHPGGQTMRSPGNLAVEGDWSNGAFFLAANALGSDLNILGLNPESAQGDKAIAELIPLLKSTTPTIDAADIPDLVPILSVLAAHFHGALFINVRRLRAKESDRIHSILEMLKALGCHASASDNELTVYPGTIKGGTVDSYADHRIAMSAGIAATIATEPITILQANSVAKSYPQFWAEYARAGGKYEQYIR